MSKKYKFRVATAGATVDGRTIKAEWLAQAAKNYDPENTYAARINVDHYMGWGAKNEEFGAFGDVVSLSTETNAKTGKLELWAELLPNARAIELNKAGQKVYTSVELIPSFADSGEAYLVGLALTDSPASLATSRIQFTAQPDAVAVSDKPFSDVGRIAKAEVFTMADPIELTFDEQDPTPTASWAAAFASLRESLANKFKAKDKEGAALGDEVRKTMDEFANLALQRIELEATRADQLQADLAALQTTHNALADEFKQLKSSLSTTPATEPRPTSTGGTTAPKYEKTPY